MSQWLLPVTVSVAAIVVMYVFCLRPMRRGRCHASSQAAGRGPGADRDHQDLDRALAAARRDLEALLAERGGHPQPTPHMQGSPGGTGGSRLGNQP